MKECLCWPGKIRCFKYPSPFTIVTNGLQELAQTLQVLVSLQDYFNYLTSLSLQALPQLSYYSCLSKSYPAPWVLISIQELHQLHGCSCLSLSYPNSLSVLVSPRSTPTPWALLSLQGLLQHPYCYS